MSPSKPGIVISGTISTEMQNVKAYASCTDTDVHATHHPFFAQSVYTVSR